MFVNVLLENLKLVLGNKLGRAACSWCSTWELCLRRPIAQHVLGDISADLGTLLQAVSAFTASTPAQDGDQGREHLGAQLAGHMLRVQRRRDGHHLAHRGRRHEGLPSLAVLQQEPS